MKKVLSILLAGVIILSFASCCENKQKITEASSGYEQRDEVSSFEADIVESDINNSQTIYRAPYGKRYHDDPDCGGKNSYEITMEQAKAAGLTPCKRCIE